MTTSKIKQSQRIFYVYVLCDPRKKGRYEYGDIKFRYQPFYVGKGHGDRPRHHVKQALKSEVKNHKLNTIRKILRTGEEPVVARSQLMTEKQALSKEKKLIRLIGRTINGGSLVNSTDGGDGVPGHRHDEKAREKMREREALRKLVDPDCHKKAYKNITRFRQDEQAFKRAQEKSLATRRTPEARAKASASVKAMWEGWDPKKRETREKRRVATLTSKSAEEKQAIADKKRATWAARSKKEKDSTASKIKQTRDSRTQKQVDATKRKRSASMKKFYAEARKSLIPDSAVKRVRRLSQTLSGLEVARRTDIPYHRVMNIIRGKDRPEIKP